MDAGTAFAAVVCVVTPAQADYRPAISVSIIGPATTDGWTYRGLRQAVRPKVQMSGPADSVTI